MHWTGEITTAIEQLGIPLSEHFELCLELDDDESSCLYYIVDHSTRSTFWLEPIPTTLLDLAPVVSMSHLSAFEVASIMIAPDNPFQNLH